LCRRDSSWRRELHAADDDDDNRRHDAVADAAADTKLLLSGRQLLQ
jgi:hypothetical protein